ncbi:hypothetical protein LB507_010958 [Fusarium sp. FIESC RH6]|nr:hypothetical protein LB507_010958 [Fusarium sp. FIESC RH6]
MQQRLRSMKRPLLLAAAATTTVAVGGGYYATRNKTHVVDKPLVPLKRDSTGRIVPPTFSATKARAEALAELRRSGQPDKDTEYDLLVIGGGATGTGIAVDAITRGLKVALVERDDFSSGTSSKSTKLVHGGVRYLEKAVWNLDYGQLQLVMEALRERKTFLNIAPHLSSSLPILLPLQKWWEAPYFWAGTKAYDLLAGSQGLESSYYMSKNKALEAFPKLRKENMVGALVYYDGQHNDSRMNVALAMTAAHYGGTVLNHVEVTGLEKDASGKINGATVRDVLASKNGDSANAAPFKVRAKGVVNATGPFTDAIHQMDDPSRKPIVAPASGVHVMLPKDICPNGIGLLDAATSDGRVIFVLPWQGFTLAGTTDNQCEVERAPVAQQNDVDFILREVSKLLNPDSALSRKDVQAAWSGIRPLVKNPNAKNTESLVRNHLITTSPSGLLTCAGGKWTTYREMAEDTVNEAIKLFDLKPQAVALPDISGANAAGFTTSGVCCTRNIPLIGAHGYSTSLASQLMEMYPIDADIADHLAHNYGDRAWTLLAHNPALNTRLVSGLPYLEAEVAHGIRAESACTVADIIARRTRLSFLDSKKALEALPRVIDIASTELQWSKARKAEEKADAIKFLASMGLEQQSNLPVQESQEERMPARAIEHSQQRPARVGGLEVDLNGLGGTGSYSKSRDE